MKQKIYLGVGPNTNTADDARLAGSKINNNFDELYDLLNTNFLGTYNATSNTPNLTAGVGQTGKYYRVLVAGTQFSETFQIGDKIEYNGTTWIKGDDANQVADLSGKQDVSEKGQPNGYASLGADGKVPLAELPQINNDLYRSWQWVSSSLEASGLLFSGITSINRYAEYGTRSFVNVLGTTRGNSIPFQNYASGTTANAQSGIKMINQADCIIRNGFDMYFVFGNNDTNSSHQTMVGSYGSTAAIPNLAISSFTLDFFGVGNDVGDSNLSFYCKRQTTPSSYIKVALDGNFPAHTTTDVYLLRLEAPQTEVASNFSIKMTLTNLITGVIATQTFTNLECPALDRPVCTTALRSNRNSGLAANFKFNKIHLTRKSF
jgi:hypothetical protein